MKTAAVVIDKWKLPVFTRHLQQAGYTYDTCAGPTSETHILKVAYEWVAKLQPIVEAAQKECDGRPAANGAAGLDGGA